MQMSLKNAYRTNVAISTVNCILYSVRFIHLQELLSIPCFDIVETEFS